MVGVEALLVTVELAARLRSASVLDLCMDVKGAFWGLYHEKRGRSNTLETF